MTLGNIVNQYRTDNHLSMEEFSKRCSLSKGYISMIENGINPRSSKPIAPTLPSIMKIATAMNMELDDLLKMMDGNQKVTLISSQMPEQKHGVTIVVLGRVAAGIPLEAIEEIVDTEEITEKLARTGEFFGLLIKGDSMEPDIHNGDTVIVRQQDDAENDEIVIALVNGNDGVCKRLKKYKDSIALVSLNAKYEPMYFTAQEVDEKPVRIIGKVVELRRKF